MTPTPPSAPLFTRDYLLLVAAHFLQALGYTSMLLLPLFLDGIGGSRADVGLVMAFAAIGGIVSRPFAGWALDRIGRRPTLLAGTILVSTGMALVCLVEEVGPLVYVARILFGVGEGVLFAGYFTFVSDIIPESRRTEGIALFGISGLLPLALNPLVGRMGISAANVPVYLAVVGVIVLLSGALMWRVREPDRDLAEEKEAPVRLRDALWRLPIAPVLVATVGFASLVSCFMSFATVTAQSRGLSDPAALWLTYALGATLLRLFGARVPDRVGTSNMVAPSFAFYVSGCVLLAGAQSTTGFMIAGMLAGFGHGWCFPVLTSQMVDRTPVAHRGMALALFTGTWELTSLTITPLLGTFADAWGDAAMFALAALVSTGLLGVWAVLEALSQRHGLRDDPRRP